MTPEWRLMSCSQCPPWLCLGGQVLAPRAERGRYPIGQMGSWRNWERAAFALRRLRDHTPLSPLNSKHTIDNLHTYFGKYVFLHLESKMRITESQLRKVIKRLVNEQIDSPQSPGYTEKRGLRQDLLAKFESDREAAKSAPVTRGEGMTPAEKLKAYSNGEVLQGLGEELVNTIEPAYDELKAQMDAAYREKDVEAFQALMPQLKNLIIKMDIARKSQRAQGASSYLFPSDRSLQVELIKSFRKMLNARDMGEKWLKDATRTPEERQRALAASQRAKSAWGSY